jgi:hypothetical protein
MKTDTKFMMVYLYASPLILLAMIIACLIYQNGRLASHTSDPNTIRMSASALEARGLYRAALDELDRYRALAVLTPAAEADLLFKMGQMSDDKLHDCERALKYFTIADSLRPDAPWSKDSGSASVKCLDKIGKAQESAALLRQLTGDKTAPAASGGEVKKDLGPVVAVLDGRSVTWAEVAAALPQSGGTAPDLITRQKMVGAYVATKMVAADARRKGYDTDPAFAAKADYARDQALAGAYLGRELPGAKDETATRALMDNLAKLHDVRVFLDAVPAP